MKPNPAQISILQDSNPIQQIIASAGSGKTSTILFSIFQNYSLDESFAEKTVLISFTRKSKEELEHRIFQKLGKNPFRIFTFHSYCLSILKRYHPNFQNRAVSIWEPSEKEKLLKEFLKAHRFQIGGIPFSFFTNEETNFFQNYFPELFSKWEEHKENHKRENHILEFSDLIKLYLLGLQQNEDWVRSARTDFENLYVDEFQDTDAEQWSWIQTIHPKRLTVVGDDWQSIYGFRGADNRPFLEFQKYYPTASVHRLETNYRSFKKIVQVSNQPILNSKEVLPKQVRSIREGKSNVSYLIWKTESSERQKQIQSLKQFLENKEYKILTRTNFRKEFWKKLGFPEENLETIHSSKGLEFETVIIDLSEAWGDQLSETIEEERRVLYVGLSRAKDNLVLVFAEHPKKESLEWIWKKELISWKKRLLLGVFKKF